MTHSLSYLSHKVFSADNSQNTYCSGIGLEI